MVAAIVVVFVVVVSVVLVCGADSWFIRLVGIFEPDSSSLSVSMFC